jgi:hypothetical protein
MIWCRGPSGCRTAPGTILLTSRFSGVAQSTTSDIRGLRPGGDGRTHFVSGGTNHARKEPGRSRDWLVTLLHCSIRTRRITTALATRRAQRGSVPQVKPRSCGTALIGSESTPAQARASSGTASCAQVTIWRARKPENMGICCVRGLPCILRTRLRAPFVTEFTLVEA